MTFAECSLDYCKDTSEGTPEGYKGRPPYCKFHYWQWKSKTPFAPRRREIQEGKRCKGPKCLRPAKAVGLCMGHYRQKFLGQDLKPLRRPTGRTMTSQGYVQVWQPGHSASDKRGWALEHRYIMSEHIGRSLLPEETVHHKNGRRADNRLSNLELWSGKHPPTMRVVDLVQYAKEILALYGGVQ